MRYIGKEIVNCLNSERKMAFVCGPRQVGKTTFARHVLEKEGVSQGYFNWDIEKDRREILKGKEDFWRSRLKNASDPLLVLDEIHKYPRWKRFLKGLFDAVRKELRILVTGSGRLNVYQRGGDSLFGRYHLFRMMPLTVGEILNAESSVLAPAKALESLLSASADSNIKEASDAFEQIFQFNGFPEPFYSGTSKMLVRWRREHRELILREDLRDLTRIRDIGLMDALVGMLPERIGSPLSLNSLREDLDVSFNTVKHWIKTLNFLYYLFEIKPFGGRLARTLKKEAKIYLFDTSVIESEGARFENIMALHLLKACYAWSDFGFGDYNLHYVRDKEKRETDFLVTENEKPWMLVECKLSGKEPDSSLQYFHKALKPKYVFQVVRQLPADDFYKIESGIYIAAAPRFLSHFP
ncbi:MAG: hypothetical protein A3H42_00575 [Deltaproteobacteria bacterium RIFCSPLOWO2_02_FULL_46_8]|nr:MAG: hypothetical protein A3H42_00575 [Deltaproteobacteria bacterium RIFCSPLOWO2_02_FULL_46_8]